MNITTILLQILQAVPTMVPAALALFNDPQFQTVLKQIEALFNQQVASGMAPATAANQAAGLAFSATALHLTGNPVNDFNSWVASLHPPVASITGVPGKPVTGGFTS